MLRFRKKAPRGCILALFVGVQSLISGTAGEVCLYVYLMYIGSQWSGVHTSLCSTKQDMLKKMSYELSLDTFRPNEATIEMSDLETLKSMFI